MVGANAAGTSSVAAGDGLDVDADEAAVAADGSPATFPVDVCCWEPDPSGGIETGGGGASLEAEEDKALTGKGRIKTYKHRSYARKKTLEESKLTWGPEPSSDPGSGAPTVVATAAAPAVVAAAAPVVRRSV
jgi:hypothetical protein